MNLFWKLNAADLDIIVRVTPNASKDVVEGIECDAAGRSHLKLRVRAIPDKGMANKAVVKLLASHFGIPKSNVSVVKGTTDRLKTIRISDGIEIYRKLEREFGGTNGCD